MIDWLKQEWFTLLSIVVSGFISWVLSAIYFYKGNKGHMEMTVLFPVLKIISKQITRGNYIELKELSQNYLTRFLNKIEQENLCNLIRSYKLVSGYNETAAQATAVLSDFEERLKKNNINPRIIPFYIDGEFVDYEYPEDINYIHMRIAKVFNENYLESESDICRNQIIKILSSFAREYYTEDPSFLFINYNLESIIRNSVITHKWDEKFNEYEEAKLKFQNMNVIKKLIKKTNFNIDSVRNV